MGGSVYGRPKQTKQALQPCSPDSVHRTAIMSTGAAAGSSEQQSAPQWAPAQAGVGRGGASCGVSCRHLRRLRRRQQQVRLRWAAVPEGRAGAGVAARRSDAPDEALSRCLLKRIGGESRDGGSPCASPRDDKTPGA